MDISVAQGRALVRQQFHLHAAYFSRLPAASASTLAAMNATLLKSTQELIEIHNRWSQKTHVMRWFEGAGERESPVYLAEKASIEVKRINEGLNCKENVSPFLENFLLNNK